MAARRPNSCPTSREPVKAIKSTSGMVDQGLASHFTQARKIVEHAGGKPRLAEDLGELPRDDRRLLGRLEHHRIAGDKCCHSHPGRDRQREIPGGYHHGNAPRNRLGVIHLTRSVAAPRLGQPAHFAGVEFAEIDRLGDVAIGFGPRFAATRTPLPTPPKPVGYASPWQLR